MKVKRTRKAAPRHQCLVMLGEVVCEPPMESLVAVRAWVSTAAVTVMSAC